MASMSTSATDVVVAAADVAAIANDPATDVVAVPQRIGLAEEASSPCLRTGVSVLFFTHVFSYACMHIYCDGWSYVFCS